MTNDESFRLNPYHQPGQAYKNQKEQWVTYAFHKEKQYPVQLIIQADLIPSLEIVFDQLGFIPIQHQTTVPATTAPTHQLLVRQAGHNIIQLLNQYREMDEHGPEGVFPEKNFLFYRYKKKALMIYTPQSSLWEMGIVPPYHLEDLKIMETVFLRFLSLVMLPAHMIGFWGHPWEDGFHLMRPYSFHKNRPSQDYCDGFFLDLKNELYIYRKNIKTYSRPLKFYVPNPSLKQNIILPKEDLFSLLLTRSTYFDYQNSPSVLQQLIKSLLPQAKAIETANIKGQEQTLENNLSN